MKIKKLTQKDALEICTWHYDGIYAFYNMEADKEDYEEFINEKTRGIHYSVFKNQELIGYFSIDKKEDTVNIGLGLKPTMTGRGYGEIFLKRIIEFINKNYNLKIITLDVACFNKRAIKVYKKVGFKEKGTFKQETNGGLYDFLHMEKSTSY